MIEMYLGLNIFIFLLRGSGTSRISPETAFATAIKFISVVTFIAESATAFPIATATQNYEKKDHQIVLRPESDHRCIADFVPDDTDPKTERLPSINLNPPCNVFLNHPKASKNKDVERTNFQHTLKTIIDTTFTGVKEKISRTIKCPSPAASGYINEIAEKNKFSEDFNKIISSAEFKAENLGLVAWFFYSKISRFIDLKFDSIALDEVRIRQIIFRIWPGSNSSRKSRRSYPSPGKIDTINKDGSEISVPADEALGVGNHIYRNLNHRNQGGHYIGVPLAISPLGKRSLTNNIKSPLRARDNSAASDTNSVKLDEDLSSDSSDATKNEEDSLKAPVKDVKIPVDVPPAQQSRIELDKHQKNTDSSEKTEGHMLNVRSIFKHVFGETLARTLPLMAVNALGLGPLMGSGARMHGHFDNSNMGYGYGGGVGGGMHTYDDDYGDDDFGMGGGLSGAYGGGLSGGYGGGLSGGYGGGLSSGYGGGLSGVYGGGLSGGYGGGLSGVYGGGLSGGYGGGLSGGYGGRYGSTLGGGVGGGLGRGLGGGKSGGYRGSLGAEDGRGGRGQTRGYGRNVGPSHNLPNNHLNLVDEINYDPPDEDYDKAPAQDSNEDLSEENFDEKPADEYHDSEFDGRGPKKNSGAGPGRKPNSKPRPKPRPIRKFSDDESKIRLKSDSLPNTTTDPAKESDIDMEGSSTSFEEPEDNHEKN